MSDGILQENVLFGKVYTWAIGLLPTGWEWLAYLLAAGAIILLVVNGLFALATWYTYIERRLLGRFQGRIGPNRAGPFGLLQPMADAIKLMTKESILPKAADRLVFNLAPVVMMASSFLVLAVVPFGAGSFLADLNIGILYVVGVSSVAVLAVLMAGWGSGSKYATLGSMRAVAALVSYEVPVVLSLLGVVIAMGSMSLVDVVERQILPLLLVQPLGFLVFVIGISAELNRSPFDLIEAESELIAGYHTEYSGMKFGALFLAEFANVLLASGLITVLFLQGWKGPVFPSYLWFLLKVAAVSFVFIWVRATLPRLRVDQILGFAWKFLLPLSLINAAALGIERMVWPAPSTAQWWAMAGINWAIAIVSVVVFSAIIARPRRGSTATVRSTSWPATVEVR